jgi:hypothetical protein
MPNKSCYYVLLNSFKVDYNSTVCYLHTVRKMGRRNIVILKVKYSCTGVNDHSHMQSVKTINHRAVHSLHKKTLKPCAVNTHCQFQDQLLSRQNDGESN